MSVRKIEKVIAITLLEGPGELSRIDREEIADLIKRMHAETWDTKQALVQVALQPPTNFISN